MEENLAIRTTVEITVMLRPIFQLCRLHQTSTAINLLVHLDLLAVATREMDMVAMAVVTVAEQLLLRLLYLLLLNHLKGLLFLNRWILRLATAMVVEAEVLRRMVEITSIIVARAVAAMMVDQVDEMMGMVGIGEVAMRMAEEVVVKDKEILDRDKDKANSSSSSKVRVRAKDSKDKANKVKAVQRGKEEVKVSLVDMRARGEDDWFSPLCRSVSALLCLVYSISRRRKERIQCITFYFVKTYIPPQLSSYLSVVLSIKSYRLLFLQNTTIRTLYMHD
jgi:hypothetical protein